MDSAMAQTVVDYGPDLPEETEIKKQLIDLQRRYAAEADPLLTRLDEIRATKCPRILYLHPANSDSTRGLPGLNLTE